MPKKKNWQVLQDPNFREKLRRLAHRQPEQYKKLILEIEDIIASPPSTSTPRPQEQPPSLGSSPSLNDELSNISDIDLTLVASDDEDDSHYETVLDPQVLNFDESEFEEQYSKMAEDALKQRVAELEAELVKQVDDSRDLKKLNEQLLTEKQGFTAEIDKLRDENDQLATDLDTLKNAKVGDPTLEIAHLKTNLDQLKKSVDEKVNVSDNFKTNNEHAEQRFEYQRRRDAARSLLKGPEVFEKPTILRTAQDFIEEYRAYAESNDEIGDQWLPGIKHFLRGKAKDFFEIFRVQYPDVTRLAAFEKKFIAEFAKLELEEIKKGSIHRKQFEDESVRDYARAIKYLMLKEKIPEDMRARFFTLNLREEFQDAVINAGAITLDQAITAAKNAESVGICSMKMQQKKDSSTLSKDSMSELTTRLNALENKHNKSVKFDRYSRRDQRKNRDRYTPQSRDSSYSSRGSSKSNYSSRNSSQNSNRSQSPYGNAKKYNRSHSRDQYYNKKSRSGGSSNKYHESKSRSSKSGSYKDRYKSGYKDTNRDSSHESNYGDRYKSKSKSHKLN